MSVHLQVGDSGDTVYAANAGDLCFKGKRNYSKGHVFTIKQQLRLLQGCGFATANRSQQASELCWCHITMSLRVQNML